MFCNFLLMFLCLRVNLTVELSYLISFKNLKWIIIVLYPVDIISQSLFFSEELLKIIFEQGNWHCSIRCI